MHRRKSINLSVELFRRMPLFEGCSRQQLQLVALVADEVLLPAGFALVREGERPRDCFIVIDGEAEVRVDGRQVATVAAPTLVGAQSLIDSTRRTSSVVTTTPTRVFSFGVRGFRQLMDLPLVAERIFVGRYDGTSPLSKAAMTACTRSRAPSLASNEATCVLTVPVDTTSSSATSALLRPRASSTSTSRSRAVSRSTG
jgi:CRP-like cAMP-binding protein